MLSIFTPEFGLVFWMLVVFLVLVLLLGKFAWPTIIESIEERASFIDQGVVYTQEAAKDREQAKVDVKIMMTDARNQQLDILQQTERMKREMIEEAKNTAKKEADTIIKSARVSIEQERVEAELQLRKQVGMLSLQIAEKVIRRNLSSDPEQMALIGQLLQETESKK